MNKKNLSILNIVLLVALVIVVAVSLYFTFSVSETKEPKLTSVKVEFLGSDCEDCFNLSPAFAFLSQQGIKVNEVCNHTIADSKKLADEYNISRLPALVLTGELNDISVPNFEKRGDALVFASSPPPYYNVAEGKVKGRVSVVHVTADCDMCFNSSVIIDQIKASGILLSDVKEVKYSSKEGKELVSKYKLQIVPTFLFSNDALEYDAISQVWPTVGSVEDDGTLVLRTLNPPYVNVSTGAHEGFVEMVYLVDSSCRDCFNTSLYEELFTQAFGMRFSSIKTVDVSSPRGKLLVHKHDVELVPTAILSDDVGLYPAVSQVWSQAGDISAGFYVFKAVPMMQNVARSVITYKNLTSNTTISTVLEEPEISPAEAEI